MSEGFLNSKTKARANVVYIVLCRPKSVDVGLFSGCYAFIEDAEDGIFREASHNVVDEVVGGTSRSAIDQFLQMSDFAIIPVFGLDKSKPIYVTTDRNYFYKAISNTKPQKGPRIVRKKYNFSGC